MYSVENGKTAKLGAYVVGADSKLEKLGGAYVVNAEQKLEKLWSSNIGKFLFFNYKKAFLSSDGISYTENGAENPNSFHSVVYALGKFWACNVAFYKAYIYNSADGENWTLVATLNSNNYFNYGILRYQNGVFILMGEYISDTSYKNVAYSTDGITWTSAHITPTGTSFSYTSKPLDVRYGTVGGVSGWYVFLINATSSANYIILCRFNSISDMASGKLTFVAKYSDTASDEGKLVIRNNKAYMVYGYFAGVSAVNSTVTLLSFNGTSFTKINEKTSYCLGTVWSTDRYLLYRLLWQTDNSTTHLVCRYDFTTETFSEVNTLGFYQHTTKSGQQTGVYVGKRMYQLTHTSGNALKGAYSDNYGSSVTRFETGLSATSMYNILVYGDDGGGWHQEQY